MSFKNENFCHVASNNRNNTKIGMFVYRTTDDLATVCTSGYFNEKLIDLKLHDIIIHEQIDAADNTKVKQNFLCVTQKTLSNVTVKIMDTDEVDGANTDLSNLSETGKANVSAQGTYDSGATYDAGTIGAALQSKADAATSANTDLSNLTSTGANIANWSSNVSNCITEIPQDIKLELNNGTLTLKAGSKVYVPNGSGIFDAVTITSDQSVTPSVFSTSSGRFVILSPNQSFNVADVSADYIYSGATAPTTFDGNGRALWYDTTNNVIKRTANSGSTWTDGFSFPIAIVDITNGVGVSKIDQVFNGFGYIGSTVFVLPGVKGLIPNGRNTDGTLKTSLWTTSSIAVRTFTDTNNTELVFNGTTFGQGAYHLGSDGYLYNNINALVASTVIGKLNRTSGKITSLTPKTVFHAVDYNDTDYIAHQAMPSSRYTDLTLPATGGTIAAQADGYLTINKSATAAGQYINFINGSNGMNCNSIATGALPLRLYIPVSKGDVITVNYDADGTTSMFRFIYANGAK